QSRCCPCLCRLAGFSCRSKLDRRVQGRRRAVVQSLRGQPEMIKRVPPVLPASRWPARAKWLRCGLLALLAGLVAKPVMADETVTVYAAGSLRAALTEITTTFSAATGTAIQPKFGASGLLKDEIVAGAKADVFASANMDHPQALAAMNRASPAVLFAR